MRQKLRLIIGFCLIAAGIILFLLPDLNTWYFYQNASRVITEWTEQTQTTEQIQTTEQTEQTEQSGESGQIADNGSAGKTDILSENYAGNMLGWIEIPAMKIKLPLYLGATAQNLSLGAGVMEEFSLPFGGESTNCVIAGHRGYRGIPYFREIEKLKPGDLVYITNTKETLTYVVESISIIDPTDSDALRIQEGRDMVTLLTCHPYRSHGKKRYLVYCVRQEEEDITTDKGKADIAAAGSKWQEKSAADNEDENEDESETGSEDDIRREKVLRRLGAVLIVCLLFITFKHNRKVKEYAE